MRKIFLLGLTLFVSIASNAQVQIANPIQQPLPMDSVVRYGKLDNGLTYYIRHNKYPEKRADFYIAQKVGSMQEEDNQAGLAHFLEHMAFSGTKHFPGRKTMSDYLESLGAKSGPNINAYTSFDETVYTLSNIPVVRQEIIDSTLLILHDWSGYISLDDENIDKERPIIKEEWRTRSGSSFRILEKQLPIIFEGSKYADRLPIGKMEVVENFEYQVIKDYYKKWYRPDLQSIIVVGDIDADKVEAQVKEIFSTIPMPSNAAKRIYYPVPDNVEPIISIISDKEETASRVTFYIKHDIIPAAVKQTEMGYTVELAIGLGAVMLNERLSELSQKAESPFTASYSGDGSFFVSKSKDAWTSIALSKEGMEKESLAALIRETERVKQFGFTDSELERAKVNLLTQIEQSYNNRDKQQNKSYTNEYVRSFIDGEPIPGLEYEFKLMQRILPTISADIVNGMLAQLLTEENNVITITGPEKDGLVYPTQAEILATIQSVRAEEIDGYIEEIITDPLISQMPIAGKVENEEYDELLDITTWTLSNGMKVAFKATSFKNDEIIMSSTAYGGLSWASDAEIYEASFINYIPYLGGIGNFSTSDLKKVLAGKNANLNVFAGQWTQGFSGRSSVNDLEILLQLTYLYFTEPRKDEEAFENFKSFVVTQLKNQKADPSYAFDQNIGFARNGYNPRFIPMRVEDAANLDYDRILKLYRQAFANPGSFSFSFVGNVDKDVLRSLVETYLASLPSGNKDAEYNNKINVQIRKGNYKTEFEESMLNAKTQVYTLYSGKLDYNQKSRNEINTLKQILDIVYDRTIREAEGGTYGVRVRVDLSRIPQGDAALNMMFDTDPEKASKLIPLIHAELQKIAEHGPEDEDMKKVKEYMLKKYNEDVKTNEYWAGIISSKVFYKEDMHSAGLEIIKNITKENIQQITQKLVNQGNLIEVVMNPLEELITINMSK